MGEQMWKKWKRQDPMTEWKVKTKNSDLLKCTTETSILVSTEKVEIDNSKNWSLTPTNLYNTEQSVSKQLRNIPPPNYMNYTSFYSKAQSCATRDEHGAQLGSLKKTAEITTAIWKKKPTWHKLCWTDAAIPT